MPESGEHLYQEIAESIRRRIASGELAPGDRLPAIRTLAKEWSCTPGTVNRAYAILGEEGLTVSHRGKGTHIAATLLHRDFSGQWGSGSRLRWATLVNRAEQYLLEAAGQGYAVTEAQAALSVAGARWRALRSEPGGEQELGKSLSNSLRFAGSHDLLLETIADLLSAAEPPLHLRMTFSGSLGGLIALMRGEADVAGTHLWDEEKDSYNEPYVRRLFPGESPLLITLAHRTLGLIVPPGRAGDFGSLEALARPDVRFVNRQRGSGTRVWLDAQLQRLKLESSNIEGYETEVATHMAVAERVATGQAQVGLGIFAAAAAFGLDFVPLTKERYDLVVRDKDREGENIRRLIRLLRSEALHETIEALGGYDSSETGRQRQMGEA